MNTEQLIKNFVALGYRVHRRFKAGNHDAELHKRHESGKIIKQLIKDGVTLKTKVV